MIGWWIGQPFWLIFVDQSNGALAQNFPHLKWQLISDYWVSSSKSWRQVGIGVMKHQCLLLGLLLPNQIHHMVNGINCCVWLTYDTQKTSQLAWSGMIVCCQSYRGYFKHILCLILFSALSSVTVQQPSTETEHQEKIKPFNKSLEQFTEFNLKLIKHNGNGIWYTSLYAHSWQ